KGNDGRLRAASPRRAKITDDRLYPTRLIRAARLKAKRDGYILPQQHAFAPAAVSHGQKIPAFPIGNFLGHVAEFTPDARLYPHLLEALLQLVFGEHVHVPIIAPRKTLL